jgi:putative spermidine/putrescine transport system permease protein
MKHRAKHRWEIPLRLSPLLLPFVAVFGCGLLITLLQSFGIWMFSYRYEDMLFAYKELFGSRWFYQSALFSLYVAAISATIAVVLGTLLAYQLWRLPQRLHTILAMYKIPLILPHIGVGFLAVILLAKTGVFSAILHSLGLLETFAAFPNLLYGSYGVDLIGAYVYKETPFVMIMIYGMLCRLDRRLLDTGHMLGASSLRIFFSLVVPYLLPIINTSFIILFVYSFGAFDLPFILGDSYPGMLAIRVYEYFFQKDLVMRPLAMALLSLMFLFSTLFIVGYLHFVRRVALEVRKL